MLVQAPARPSRWPRQPAGLHRPASNVRMTRKTARPDPIVLRSLCRTHQLPWSCLALESALSISPRLLGLTPSSAKQIRPQNVPVNEKTVLDNTHKHLKHLSHPL